MSELQNKEAANETSGLQELMTDVRKQQRLVKKSKKGVKTLRKGLIATEAPQEPGVPSAIAVFADFEKAMHDFEIALLKVEQAIESWE